MSILPGPLEIDRLSVAGHVDLRMGYKSTYVLNAALSAKAVMMEE